MIERKKSSSKSQVCSFNMRNIWKTVCSNLWLSLNRLIYWLKEFSVSYFHNQGLIFILRQSVTVMPVESVINTSMSQKHHMTYDSRVFISNDRVYVKQSTDLWNTPQLHPSSPSMHLHQIPNRGKHLLYFSLFLFMQYLLNSATLQNVLVKYKEMFLEKCKEFFLFIFFMKVYTRLWETCSFQAYSL